MTWKVTGYANHPHSHCQACGMGITHNWFISDGTNSLRVGTECMYAFTGAQSPRKLRSLIRAASAIYEKGMDYGPEFRSFWMDYYINAQLVKARVPLSVYTVYQWFFRPYHPEPESDEPIPF